MQETSALMLAGPLRPSEEKFLNGQLADQAHVDILVVRLSQRVHLH